MISHFTTGLALVAISANANSWGQAPPQNPEWIQSGSHQPSWQPSQPSWQTSQPSHNYWQPTHESAPAPQAAPEAAPEPTAYNPWAPQQPAYNHYPAPAPVPEKPEGWYSHTQQYTAPNIRYVPEVYEPVYAVCEFGAGNFLELAQLPNHPIYIRGTISGVTMETDVEFTINAKGKLGDTCDVADTGAEFNPLYETDKYGNPNPYQDPSRGTIASQTSDINGDVSIDGSETLLQNLDGEDSLIGRSISFNEEGAAISGCCVIGLDSGPMDAEEHDPHHHEPSHPHYPSHGGYQQHQPQQYQSHPQHYQQPSYQPHPQQYQQHQPQQYQSHPQHYQQPSYQPHPQQHQQYPNW